jgi:hypothetical protein
MATSERRREERIKVRFPCELAFGRKRVAGTVLDLSAGGLSVESEGRADQGQTVYVQLQPKGQASIDVEALVWNVRRFKHRGSGKAAMRLGLVLSDAPDEFLELLKAKAPPAPDRPRKPAPPVETAEPPPPEPEEEPEPPVEERRFRARVKQSATTRTRVILVFATSAEDAEAKALAEAGDGWILLEVEAR